MRRFLPYSRQDITQEDKDAVLAVLDSDFLTQGRQVPVFEQRVAGYCGSAHAVAVNNGSAALYIACRALGIGTGDRVWTSPNSFVASASCAMLCGASVDFVDIDPHTRNLCPDRLAEKLADAKAQDRLPSLVIAVHYAGLPCDMERLRLLSGQYGFAIIEDAAQALGSRYKDSRTGDCRYSDICIFSFHPTKTITCGEGGMAMTNRPELADAMRLIRNNGITRTPFSGQTAWDGWYYEQRMAGGNYRMSDIQAALGHSQMARIDSYLARRTALAERYDQALANLPLRLPARPSYARGAHHLYAIAIAPDQTDRTRPDLYRFMHAAGMGVNVHYIPIHTQPYFQERGFRQGDFPQAEAHYAHCLSIPLFPGMTDDEQDDVIATLRNFFSG